MYLNRIYFAFKKQRQMQLFPWGWKIFLALVCSMAPNWAMASELNGAALSTLWAVPFAGLLLSIALVPLIASQFWHHHFGKVAMAWAALFMIPFAYIFGSHVAIENFAHALMVEYTPFIALLVALYIVSGGIYIKGNLHGAPGLNTAILALGAVLASFMGTTGASMLLIRPLIRANDNRKHRVHVIVFFIFIVANAGGVMTPLGDPPLFLGFLKGVSFFWTVSHLFPETLFIVGALLVIFYAIDYYHYHHKEEILLVDPTTDTKHIGVEGGHNFLLLLAIIALVLMSGIWKSQVHFEILGTQIQLQNIIRDIGLVMVAIVSWKTTKEQIHKNNHFSWEPILEVAKLFAGIFLTIIPVIAMLRAGMEGPFASIVGAVTHANGHPNPAMYFWATGFLSSFLDNAPTYLVFFNTAGGDAAVLMTQEAATLAAISAGAVFMGANTYIGNAPNLMVKAIAQSRGVHMPSFFGYMLWSFGILVPLFVIMTFIWFR